MSNNPSEHKYPYGYGLSKGSLFKLYMNKANVQKWSFTLSLSALSILFLWSLIKEYIFNGETYKFIDGYIFTLACCIWGYLGLFWAYRRQVPQIVVVKGKPAFMLGVFMMIVGWSLALYFLIGNTRDLIEIILK